MRSLRAAFTAQRLGAAHRGIAFRLTFEQWLEIWRLSGRLSQRGARKGKYVMARYRDRGPYAIGNVKIILFEDNLRETFQNLTPKKQAAWRARGVKAGRANKGRPRPDLSEFNASRAGIPLAPEHRQKLSIVALGKKRGPYKTWKGKPR